MDVTGGPGPRPTGAYLTKVTGDGGRWDLPAAGRVVIGRLPSSDVAILDDAQVSCDHAQINGAHGGWFISDAVPSTNGTFVNGSRVVEDRPIHDGDEIVVGETVLAFHCRPVSPDPVPVVATQGLAAPPPLDTSSRVRVARILLIAGVIEALGLVGNGVTTFATTRTTGVLRWALPPAIAIGIAMVAALVDLIGKKGEAEPASRPTSSATSTTMSRPGLPPGPRVGRQRGLPAVAGVLVLLLVVGVGGVAATAGVRYAVGYVTGKEDGRDRLVAPVTKASNGLTATVHHVFQTSHFTRVDLTIENGKDQSISLPLFGYCTLTGSGGATLQADSFKSQWSDTIPPGVPQRGVITFAGHLPRSARSATLTFSVVFGPGGGQALKVPALTLTS